MEIMNKPLFLNKGKHIYCYRHFPEHGESAKGGWGIRRSAALKSAQCRKLYFGICCFAQMKTLEFVFWSRNKAICPHHTCLLLFVIFLFFPMAFTAIKSQCSPQVSTFTLQDGGSVPAELPADGCTVDGGGREHQGAVQ